jgi:hypothetical protein
MPGEEGTANRFLTKKGDQAIGERLVKNAAG